MSPEQNIQSCITKYLLSEGAYVVNVVTASKKGVSDLLVCYKGRFIALEIKTHRTRNNVSPVQRYNLEWVEKAGGIAAVVYDVEQVKVLLRSNLL